MTPQQMRNHLALPGWSARECGRRTGRNPDIVREMTRGKRHIDNALATWLEAVAAEWSKIPTEYLPLARQLGCADGRPVEKGNLPDGLHRSLSALSDFHRSLKPPPLELTEKIVT